MKFQQIRSATAIITYGGVRFLIDPWLSEKDAYPPIPGSPHPELRCPIHELSMPVEKIMEVDAVIATHLHFDHFDETATVFCRKLCLFSFRMKWMRQRCSVTAFRMSAF